MLSVNEVFESVQGEGMMTGREATFIRFQGCNCNCSFCDTKEAQGVTDSDAKHYAPKDLVGEVKNDLVILTGGEPFLQDWWQLEELCRMLKDMGKTIAVETNGTMIPTLEIVKNVDLFTVSPKEMFVPGGKFGHNEMTAWTHLVKTGKVDFKFVIKSAEDVANALGYLGYRHPLKPEEEYVDNLTIILQPEWSKTEEIFDKLPEWTEPYIEENLRDKIYYKPQMHKLLDQK